MIGERGQLLQTELYEVKHVCPKACAVSQAMGGGSGSTVPGNQLPVVFENLRDPERCDPMTASSSAHVLWQLQTLLFNQHSTEYTTFCRILTTPVHG